MPGGIAMNSDIEVQPIKVSIKAVNTSSTASKLQLYYSTNQGTSWTSIGTENAAANYDGTISWHLILTNSLYDSRLTALRDPRT